MTDRMDARWQACRQELADAAARAGVDPALLAKIAGFESGYDPHARPIAPHRHAALNTVIQFDGTRAMSSAYGYGQFTTATWGSLIRQHGEDYGVANAPRLTDAQASTPTLRADTRLQAAMLAEFTRQNVNLGARLGGPDASANVYALHNLGSGAGAAFLKAVRDNPGRRMDAVLPRAIIERNPSLYGDGSDSVADAYRVMGQQLDRYASYAADIRRLASPGQTVSSSHALEPATHPLQTSPRPRPCLWKAQRATWCVLCSGAWRNWHTPDRAVTRCTSMACSARTHARPWPPFNTTTIWSATVSSAP